MSGVAEMPVIAVLAGGIANRMRPLTDAVPKSMLKVAGEPFIAHQLRLLHREGIRKVVLCVGHLGEIITNYVRDGASFDLDVRYSHDGDRALGSGGALRRALPLLGSEFLILYGDSYLDIPFEPLVSCFRASGLDGAMTVFANSDTWGASTVTYKDDRILFYSKDERRADMRHIDYGLTMLRASVLESYPDNTAFDLAEVYSELVRSGRMAGFEVHTRFYEIGSLAGLAATESYILGAGNSSADSPNR